MNVCAQWDFGILVVFVFLVKEFPYTCILLDDFSIFTVCPGHSIDSIPGLLDHLIKSCQSDQFPSTLNE